jgi:hypothetical protein
MRWRWPPWRREEPKVQGIERSGETVNRAKAETVRMGQEIYQRAEQVREGAADLAAIVERSMRRKADN